MDDTIPDASLDAVMITVNGESFRAVACPRCGCRIWPPSDMDAHSVLHNASGEYARCDMCGGVYRRRLFLNEGKWNSRCPKCRKLAKTVRQLEI